MNPTALYALAAPSTPDPVRAEVLERAANGEKVTAKEIETLKKSPPVGETDGLSSDLCGLLISNQQPPCLKV